MPTEMHDKVIGILGGGMSSGFIGDPVHLPLPQHLHSACLGFQTHVEPQGHGEFEVKVFGPLFASADPGLMESLELALKEVLPQLAGSVEPESRKQYIEVFANTFANEFVRLYALEKFSGYAGRQLVSPLRNFDAIANRISGRLGKGVRYWQ